MILLNAGFTAARVHLQFDIGTVRGNRRLDRLFRARYDETLLPYALAVAAASFIYIALSDLLPEMMRRSSLRSRCPRLTRLARRVDCRLGDRRLPLVSQPVATGRAGSAIHSLHEPPYRAEPGSPASSIANTLWHAVTPEPHW